MTPSLPSLGRSLRPIVFGSPPGAAGAPEDLAPFREVVLGVHAADGEPLGYVALRLGTEEGGAWGGACVSERLTVHDARILGARAALQAAVFGLAPGGHHCLVTVPAGTQAAGSPERLQRFGDAVEPIVQAGLCEIVYTEGDRFEPPAAHLGVLASGIAAATAVTSRRHRGDPTVATHEPGTVGAELVRELGRRGFRPLPNRARGMSVEADVLILGGPPAGIGLQEATAFRAGTVLAIAACVPTAQAEQRLHERGILFVPDTLAAGGRLAALRHTRAGAHPIEAAELTGREVAGLLDELLDEAERRAEPLVAALRRRLRGEAPTRE
jgi:glutamate dehydrogenase/leucine dehydrogenase